MTLSNWILLYLFFGQFMLLGAIGNGLLGKIATAENELFKGIESKGLRTFALFLAWVLWAFTWGIAQVWWALKGIGIVLGLKK